MVLMRLMLNENEKFVNMPQGFKDILMYLTPKTLFDRIFSKEPLWRDFCCIQFLSQPCKIKLVGAKALVRIVILIYPATLIVSCDLPLPSAASSRAP